MQKTLLGYAHPSFNYLETGRFGETGGVNRQELLSYALASLARGGECGSFFGFAEK
ncbi:MAG: hypothetical protein U5L45_20840 [Saprospiraceae bacterium]|nr:hypothetical protein [Saprospiraceae bacterium]